MTRSYSPRIGVLALQGAFQEHVAALKKCGACPVEIRTAKHLQGLNGLVLPGGESTVMAKLLIEGDLLEPLQTLCTSGIRVMGTCAGMILLASEISGHRLQPHLGLVDISVRRNAFGRQINSFATLLPVCGLNQPEKTVDQEQTFVKAVFIRAPVIERAGPAVSILATINNAPVAVRQGNILALSFHPELTEELSFHRWLCNI